MIIDTTMTCTVIIDISMTCTVILHHQKGLTKRRIQYSLLITKDSHSSFTFLCPLLLSLTIHPSPLLCVLNGFDINNSILILLSFISCTHSSVRSFIDTHIRFLTIIHSNPSSPHNSSLLISYKSWTSSPIPFVEIEYSPSILFIQELLRTHLIRLCQLNPSLSFTILLFTTVLSFIQINTRSIPHNDKSRTIIYSFKRFD